MVCKKRIQTRIALRRELVAKYAVEGYSVRKIPEKLAQHDPPILSPTGGLLSKSLVSADIEFVRGKWRANAEEKIGRHVADQLAVLREVQHRAWENHDLELVLKAHDRLSKLLGTNAPDRQEVSGPGGGPVEMMVFTPEQADAMLRHMIPEYASEIAEDNAEDTD